MKLILNISIILLLLSCQVGNRKNVISNTTSDSSTDIQSKEIHKEQLIPVDTIDFKMVSGDKIKKFNLLDSATMTKWTDNYMPDGLVELKLYSAFLISEGEVNNNVKTKIILTYADDWSRMHIITCAPDSSVLNIKEIGENMSHLMEQEELFEMYMELDSKLLLINDSTFRIERQETTVKDFYDESKKDSVVIFKTDSIFKIDINGKIKNWL